MNSKSAKSILVVIPMMLIVACMGIVFSFLIIATGNPIQPEKPHRVVSKRFIETGGGQTVFYITIVDDLGALKEVYVGYTAYESARIGDMYPLKSTPSLPLEKASK